MTGDHKDEKDSVVEREKKLRALEEQLAREREELSSFKMKHKTEKQTKAQGDISEKHLNLDELSRPVNSEKKEVPDVDDIVKEAIPDKGDSITEPEEAEGSMDDFSVGQMEDKLDEMDKIESPGSWDNKDIGKEIDEYKDDINDFRERGYNVTRLYDIFSEDIETIRQKMLTYMGDVTGLKSLEKKLNSIDTTGVEKEEKYLRKLLKNPDAAEEAKSFMDDIKEKLREKESKKKEKKILEIESIFDKMIDSYQEFTEIFDDEIEEIKASIIDLDETPLEEFYPLKKKIFKLRDSMKKEKKRKEATKKLASIFKELEKWRKKGFDITEIKEMFRETPKEAMVVYKDFVENAKKLLGVEKELKNFARSKFATEIKEIKSIIRDHTRAIEAENKLESLRRRSRLSNIQSRMERLKKPEKTIVKKKESQRQGPTEMNCPKCGGNVQIPSDDRPLKVKCSSCGTEFNLKRIPHSKEAQTQKPVTSKPESPNVEQQSSRKQMKTKTIPAPSEPPEKPESATQKPKEMETKTQESKTKEKKGKPEQELEKSSNICPKCGSELLPDSMFCGICGYRMDG